MPNLDSVHKLSYKALLVIPEFIDEAGLPTFKSWRLSAMEITAAHRGIKPAQIYVLTSKEVLEVDLRKFKLRTVIMGVMAEVFAPYGPPMSTEPLQPVTGEFITTPEPRFGIFPELTGKLIKTPINDEHNFDVVLVSEHRILSYCTVDTAVSQRTNSLRLDGLCERWAI